MNSLINHILIKLSCKKVGLDEFGNSYYENKKSGRRFIVYKGIAEPSKIPAEWHGWIHYSTDLVPVKINTRKASWQKIHLPNLTGTVNAYHPNKDLKNKTSAVYEPWEPK